MSQSLEHALHNEEVCNHLSESDTWNDWVVTTAFYSAVHFVEARLFPLKVKDETFERFEEYFAAKVDRSRTSHESRKNLVKARLNKAVSSYEWLLDNCHSARYRDYRISNEKASEARKKLAVVKSLCVAAPKPAPKEKS